MEESEVVIRYIWVCLDARWLVRLMCDIVLSEFQTNNSRNVQRLSTMFVYCDIGDVSYSYVYNTE